MFFNRVMENVCMAQTVACIWDNHASKTKGKEWTKLNCRLHVQTITFIWELERTSVTSPIKCHGSNQMTSIQSPFFHNTDATMLEPDDISNQWLARVCQSRRFSDNHSFIRRELVVHTLPYYMKARKESVNQTIWKFDVRLTTFIEASDWTVYDE